MYQLPSVADGKNWWWFVVCIIFFSYAYVEHTRFPTVVGILDVVCMMVCVRRQVSYAQNGRGGVGW